MKQRNNFCSQPTRKSIAASIMISFGVCVLLMAGNPVGPFLFSLGLLSVCIFKLNLFTGKCGYIVRGETNMLDLGEMLCINFLSAEAMGVLFRYTFGDKIIQAALTRMEAWEVSPGFFIKSVLCGMIMFIAVDTYRKGYITGILFGVPLFILCGFQHCIANVVIMSIANKILIVPILLCILGNFTGSVIISWLLREEENNGK